MPRSGGRVLVDQLELHGTELVFGVPGESYLEILDALVDSPIRFVTCRHEAGAANMAEAHGKLTGRPGVCLVTRGPGATHASVGVHTAFQDGTPMILLVGQVPRHVRGRDAFQELDYAAVFGSMTKWAFEVDAAERLPELLQRAFRIASSGRAGPVVLALPEDMLVDQVEVGDALPFVRATVAPRPEEVEAARRLLAAADRPLVVIGGQPWSEAAAKALAAWCEASSVPIAAGWRCQDHVDNTSPAYVGHLGLGPDPRLARRLRDADVLLVVGSRLGDIETLGYTTIEPPGDGRTLVHVLPTPDELGRVYAPTLGLVASGAAFAEALAATAPLDATRWRADTDAGHAEFLETLEGRPMPGAIDLGQVMASLRQRLGPDAIVTNGAGNFTVWAHRFYAFRRFPTQLAPTSGAMGYGLPAAIAAKLTHPERDVVCIAGDGDFVMSLPELATAVQAQAPIVVLVVDNGMFGTIRMHQERHYPGRVSGTDLVNPDFVALAQSFGAFGERVERTEDFAGALERALSAGRPAVLELPVDPEALTPRQTLSEIRDSAARGRV